MGGWLTRHGEFVAGVRAEADRLAAWERHPGLAPADRAFARRLRRLYAAVRRPGPDLGAAAAAVRLAPFFHFGSPAGPARLVFAALCGSLMPAAR